MLEPMADNLVKWCLITSEAHWGFAYDIISEGIQCGLFLHFSSFTAASKMWFPIFTCVQISCMALEKVLDAYCCPGEDGSSRVEVFKTFDLDGDGKINEAELSKMLPRASPEQIKQMISKADMDGDDALNLEELATTELSHELDAYDHQEEQQAAVGTVAGLMRSNYSILIGSIQCLWFALYQAESPFRTSTYDILLTLFYWLQSMNMVVSIEGMKILSTPPHVANVGGELGLKRYHAPRRIQRGQVQSWRITIALYSFSFAFFFYTFVLAIQYWLSGDIEEDFDKYYTLYIIISSSAMIILAIAVVLQCETKNKLIETMIQRKRRERRERELLSDDADGQMSISGYLERQVKQEDEWVRRWMKTSVATGNIGDAPSPILCSYKTDPSEIADGLPSPKVLNTLDMNMIQDVIVHETDKKAFVVLPVTDTPHPVSRERTKVERRRAAIGPRQRDPSTSLSRADSAAPRRAAPRPSLSRSVVDLRISTVVRPSGLWPSPDSRPGSRPGSASLALHRPGSRAIRVEGAPVRPAGNGTAPNATLDRENSRRAARRSLRAAAPNLTHERAIV